MCHLVVGHIPGLADAADALSRWHLGHHFRDKVASLIVTQGFKHNTVPYTLFVLADIV